VNSDATIGQKVKVQVLNQIKTDNTEKQISVWAVSCWQFTACKYFGKHTPDTDKPSPVS